MKKRRSFLIATLLVPFLLFGCARNSGTSAEDAGRTVGRSANWRAEVVSAKLEKIPTKPGQPYELVLKLKIQYLGPSGSVRSPTFNVINEREEKLSFSGTVSFPADTVGLAGWLMSGVTDSMFGRKDPPSPESLTSLETGKSFEFGINYLEARAGKLRLVFADVPPIPFEVSSGS